MRNKLIISGFLLAFCTMINAQTMVGLSKEEVQAIVKKDHKQFRKDNSIIKQRFNYLKYVNGIKTRTWILYFDDKDICKTSKLVCDYAEYDEVIEGLSESFEKVGDSRWEFTHKGEVFEVNLIKQEWYFTVRETRKQEDKKK